MHGRRCLICFAVIGTCLHTAHQPYDSAHVEPLQPNQFVVPAMTVSASTSSTHFVGSGALHVVQPAPRRPPITHVVTLRAPLVPPPPAPARPGLSGTGTHTSSR